MFLAILVIFVILVVLMPVIVAFVPSKDNDSDKAPGQKRAKTYEEEFRGKKHGQELYDDLWDDDLF